MCGSETAIAFAGEKWVILVRFLVAKVLSVSRGRAAWPAKVLLVSRGRAVCRAKVLVVSKLPSSRAMCEKVRPARPGMGVSAKKFAQHA